MVTASSVNVVQISVRQVVPPALLLLGNVLLNGPQNCLETTALLSLILDDPAKNGEKKQQSIAQNKILGEGRVGCFFLFL